MFRSRSSRQAVLRMNMRSESRAVLYARVSSRDQEREGFSIPAQLKLLRDYAHGNAIAIEAEFVDVESARRTGRSEFGAMVGYLESHSMCRSILVEKTDRLYRNIKDWVTLDDLAVAVHLVKEGVVISESSVSSEKFVHGIKVLMAKNYIDNLSEETRKGMAEKAREGLWPSRAPLGYLNVARSDGKRIIVPDPVLGPLVAKVFEWYAAGDCAISPLTERATSAGLVFRQSKRPLSRSQVHYLLRNPVYTGDFLWQGESHRGIHIPLVDRAVWDRVQDILDGRAPRRRLRRKRDLCFAGLIQCGACAEEGRRFLLVGDIKKEKYVYYHCEECKRRGRVTYVREEEIVEAFIAALSSACVHDDALVMAGNQFGLNEPGARASLELGQLLDVFRNTADPARRRRFIEVLHSNSTWKASVMTVTLRQHDEIAAHSREAG